MQTLRQQPSDISKVISEAFTTSGITQRDAAERTGIALATLNRRLNTNSSFLVTELEALAVLLETTVSALFERAEAPKNSGNAA